MKAITALGEIGNDKAVSALLSIVKEVESPYQHRIIMTLGKKRSVKALQPLLELLNKHAKQKTVKHIHMTNL